MSPVRICFILSPIGEPNSPTRRRSDDILEFLLRPAAGECGYEALRADEIDKPGMITSQIVEYIISAPMVVADLTDGNPNVFYELALRHAVKKPAVHMIQSGQRPPFDLGGNRIISVDHTDLRSVESAKTKLKAQITAAEVDPEAVDNPISIAMEIKALRVSGNPLAESVGRIEEAVHELGMTNMATREMSAAAGPLSHAFHAAQGLRDQLGDAIQSLETPSMERLVELYNKLVNDVVTPLGMMRRHYGLSRFDPAVPQELIGDPRQRPEEG